MSLIRDVLIKTVGTGILISDDAYYNDLFCLIIMGAGVGINIKNGANENRIFGGRIQNVRYGIRFDDVSNPQIYGTSIGGFSVGIHIGPKPVSHPKVVGSRLENFPKGGMGIRIAPTTLAAFIIGTYFEQLDINIEDLAKDTNVVADQHWQISSNTIIRQHA